MTEAFATIKGRKLDARYTLIDKLGAGGQGEVWRAHDSTRGIDVALKVVGAAGTPEAAWNALEHEYAIASRLDHPSILKVYPPHRTPDAMALPMELASGGDLRKLRGAGFLEIIPALLEIAQALEHAHERGVVHRDLKPGNVLFDVRGRARLADFGVAETSMSQTPRDASTPSPTTRDTNNHGFSPFTASPAQLRGEPPTPADDIYGLGALAYELLSGYPPYYPHFDKKRAIEEPVPKLVPTRQIPPLLSALVMNMLAKDPKQRPRTMREIIDELDAALNDTLTFDFENVSKPAPVPGTTLVAGASEAATGAQQPKGASELPPAVATPDNATIHLSTSHASVTADRSKPFAESPASGGERRTTPDRRSRAREDSVPLRIREPKLASDLRGTPASAASEARAGRSHWAPQTGADEPIARVGDVIAPPDDLVFPSRSKEQTQDAQHERSGVDALARIDAALARAAAQKASTPPTGASQTERRSTDPRPSVAAPAVARSGQVSTARASAAPVEAPMYPAAAPMPAAVPPGIAHPASPPPTRQPAAADALLPPAQPLSAHAPVFAREAPPTAGPGAPIRTWADILVDDLPRPPRLQRTQSRRWPWVMLGLVAGAAAALYFWLPRFDPGALPASVSALVAPIQSALTPARASPSTTPQSTEELPATGAAAQPAAAAPSGAAEGDATTPSSASDEQRVHAMRQAFDSRLAALESRGAGVWGGRDFAMAKTRAAESVGASDAGNPRMAEERLTAAMKLLDSVAAKAPEALSAQVAAGEKALGSGQQEVAGQAFDLARRIDPSDRRATDGQRRAQNLNGVLPLLADGQNAEAAHDYARAAQDYSQALSIDANNATAKAGQARANAAFGDDNYAKAVGEGFAALGAGRFDEARASFAKARALKPNGAEAVDGLKRVSAALNARNYASLRQHAIALEAQERWYDAENVYEDALGADSTLAFAQEGRARAASRADLDVRLQQLIDRPDRLSAPGVRADARALLETAEAQSPQGPILHSQIARLQALLPNFDKPVRLSLLSDNSTQVAISSIGSFGAFSRRDIELRPGKYIVVGTRNGFRDVRREITVAPGQDTQTIKVTCSEPI